MAFDALDTDAHAACLDQIWADHPDLDLVLVAFGVLGDQTHFDADPAEAVEAVRINYVGAVSVGLLAAGHLREQGHGTLVVLSSVAAERARRTTSSTAPPRRGSTRSPRAWPTAWSAPAPGSWSSGPGSSAPG